MGCVIVKFVLVSLILAGGESKRMGLPKLTLSYQGKTLLSHAITKAKSVSDETLVVVGAYATYYQPEAEKAGSSVIINEAWAEGLASSLRVGIASFSKNVDAALVILPDQPFVPIEHLQTLVKTWQETNAQLVFSRYQGILGAPCIISRSLFADVQTLRGDKGARGLAHEGVIVAEVGLEHSQDIDTPEDAKKLEAEGRERRGES
jgi:molybdenum cofactor cytidylyltransferase